MKAGWALAKVLGLLCNAWSVLSWDEHDRDVAAPVALDIGGPKMLQAPNHGAYLPSYDMGLLHIQGVPRLNPNQPNLPGLSITTRERVNPSADRGREANTSVNEIKCANLVGNKANEVARGAAQDPKAQGLTEEGALHASGHANGGIGLPLGRRDRGDWRHHNRILVVKALLESR